MDITFNYTKYQDKNPIQKLLIKRFFNTVLSMLNNFRIRRALDVGCGEGILLSKLHSHHIGEYLEGVDNLKSALALAKKLYPQLIIKQGDIYKLPYKSNSFDLVVCTEVLEHLTHPKIALRQLRRVTSKYCLVSVPNEPIFRIANFLRGRYLLRFGNTPGHTQHWSKKQFVEFAKSEGFEIISVKISFPWIVVLLKKT